MYPSMCPVWRVPAYMAMCSYCSMNTKTNIPTIQIPEEIEEKMFRATPKKSFTTEEALMVAMEIGLDFNREMFDIEQFRKGMDVELEHGTRNPQTDVTGDNPILIGKIALAHLREFPDYYIRLSKMEEDAKAFWGITD